MNIAPDTARDLDGLISYVRESSCSDFYRSRWGDVKAFDALPCLSRADLVSVPFSERRYKQKKGMVKIVGAGDKAFLSEWSFSDIGSELYGQRTARPLVYMTDPYEAVEKAIWCYENNMVPLLGEKDPDMAMFAASRYQIDSLITDQQALVKFEPFLSALSEPLASITILGDAFSPDVLMSFERYARSIRLVLSLPEAGAFAEAVVSHSPKFIPLPGCIIENDSGIVLTKLARYPTPIIRYRTGVASDLFA